MFICQCHNSIVKQSKVNNPKPKVKAVLLHRKPLLTTIKRIHFNYMAYNLNPTTAKLHSREILHNPQ